jgi:hypothetical protein
MVWIGPFVVFGEDIGAGFLVYGPSKATGVTI